MVHLGLSLLNGLRGPGQNIQAGGRSEQAAFDKLELSGPEKIVPLWREDPGFTEHV